MRRSHHMCQGKVILVVDDEADLREILRDELKYEGATVLEASGGLEALQIVKDRAAQNLPVEMIISDIRMPAGDGWTLTREVRAQHPSLLAIILITGFADLHAEEAFAMGADSYLTKPFQLDRVKKEIQRLSHSLREQRKSEISGKALRLNETLPQLLRTRKMNLGRRGAFLRMSVSQYRTDELVQLQMADGVAICGMIRWSRSEESPTRPPGIGFEFAFLSPEVIKLFDTHQPGWDQLREVIPLT